MKEEVLETVFCNKIKELIFRAVLIDRELMFQVSENGGGTWQNTDKTENGQSFLDCYKIVALQDNIKSSEGLYVGFDVVPIPEANKEQIELLKNTAEAIKRDLNNRIDSLILTTETSTLIHVVFLNVVQMYYGI